MTAAPVPTNFAALDTATEALMDATTNAITFLRSPPRASLTRSSNQTIADSTNTAVQFNAEEFDSEGGHDTVTNNTRYTAVYDGVYLVTYAVPWAATASEFKGAAWIRRSDGTDFAPSEIYKSTFNVSICCTGSSLVTLSTSEYVEIYCWQDRGGNLAIDQTQHGGPRMSVLWVSAT